MEEDSEIVLEETQLEEGEEEGKKQRKKITLDTHLEKYQKLLSIIEDEIERKQKAREPGIRNLQSIKKLTKELEHEIPKVARIKRKNNSAKKVSGFSLQYPISDELAKFMGLPKGATPTRVEITNAICAYINIKPGETKEQIVKWKSINPNGRNLQDPNDKMHILPDAKLKKLVRYDDYVKDVKAGKVFKKVTNKETGIKEKVLVTDPALSYSVIQQLIQVHISKTTKAKKDEDFEILS